MDILKTASFRDLQGVLHPAAAFVIAQAKLETFKRVDYSRNVPKYSEISEKVSGDIRMTVQFYYWESSTDLEQPHKVLKNLNWDEGGLRSTAFVFVPESTAATVEQACLAHLENYILPKYNNIN